MGIPIIEGRDFTMQDNKEESRVVIVNETLRAPFLAGRRAQSENTIRTGRTEQPILADRWCRERQQVLDGSSEDPQPFVYYPDGARLRC